MLGSANIRQPADAPGHRQPLPPDRAPPVPDLPAHRYPEIAAEVRRICTEHGLPYNTGPLWKRGRTCGRRMSRLALPAAHPGRLAGGDHRTSQARAGCLTRCTDRQQPGRGNRPPAAWSRQPAMPLGARCGAARSRGHVWGGEPLTPSGIGVPSGSPRMRRDAPDERLRAQQGPDPGGRPGGRASLVGRITVIITTRSVRSPARWVISSPRASRCARPPRARLDEA